MTASGERPVGLTKDVGFQIGVRRTLPIRLEDAWQLLTSGEGRKVWLGETADLDFTRDTPYHRAVGPVGQVSVFFPNSHLRLPWQPPGWERASTIQVRVIASGERTVVAFHQEHLPDGQAREARRAHYTAALDRLERLIAG